MTSGHPSRHKRASLVSGGLSLIFSFYTEAPVRPNDGDTALRDEYSRKTDVTKSFKFQAINCFTNTVIIQYAVP